MTHDEWRTVMARGFAAAGWVYALMLTAKDTAGILTHVLWYEMLIADVLIILVLIPVSAWIYLRIWGPSNDDRVEAPPPAGEHS